MLLFWSRWPRFPLFRFLPLLCFPCASERFWCVLKANAMPFVEHWRLSTVQVDVPSCVVGKISHLRENSEVLHEFQTLICTRSVSNCSSFDFFYLKFDNSSYLKICAKYYYFYCGLFYQYKIFKNDLNLTIFVQIFWIRRVVKLRVKKFKRTTIWNGSWLVSHLASSTFLSHRISTSH